MRLLSLFLVCRHLCAGTNLRECEDQSRVKLQAVQEEVFFNAVRSLRVFGGTHTPG
jgi:hypothetical protein